MFFCLCVYAMHDAEEKGGHNMAQWNLWEPVERSALHFIFFFFFWFRSGTCCLQVGGVGENILDENEYFRDQILLE